MRKCQGHFPLETPFFPQDLASHAFLAFSLSQRLYLSTSLLISQHLYPYEDKSVYFHAALSLLAAAPIAAANTTETVPQVEGTVTLSADVDYVITSATPFANGAVVNITNTDNAVLILPSVKPSAVPRLFPHIQINGVKASSANCMVKIYANGSIILPHSSSVSPLVVYAAASR